jgi:hypothetical protein
MRFGLKELGLGLVGLNEVWFKGIGFGLVWFSDWAVKWFWVWIMTRG